ncbi:hypothetical protein B0T26DRAFT_803563 [Lasiosphaeria miniovina]|uniref:Uncharacterized protein n=1 Tax=Lasiosphaeria miniovina TaxID=1954250 RepID=A0AA40DR60_9PEZI|nr:uncharacterized protein B0T26DRAFT_803563 [Lasiosphaeria miniovina]KAK0712490.1 hypothetical protein B0T26DRAFT_803563 [Lasiosphaeria miniovina]
MADQDQEHETSRFRALLSSLRKLTISAPPGLARHRARADDSMELEPSVLVPYDGYDFTTDSHTTSFRRALAQTLFQYRGRVPVTFFRDVKTKKANSINDFAETNQAYLESVYGTVQGTTDLVRQFVYNFVFYFCTTSGGEHLQPLALHASIQGLERTVENNQTLAVRLSGFQPLWTVTGEQQLQGQQRQAVVIREALMAEMDVDLEKVLQLCPRVVEEVEMIPESVDGGDDDKDDVVMKDEASGEDTDFPGAPAYVLSKTEADEEADEDEDEGLNLVPDDDHDDTYGMMDNSVVEIRQQESDDDSDRD